jgi:hypothetical protein
VLFSPTISYQEGKECLRDLTAMLIVRVQNAARRQQNRGEDLKKEYCPVAGANVEAAAAEAEVAIGHAKPVQRSTLRGGSGVRHAVVHHHPIQQQLRVLKAISKDLSVANQQGLENPRVVNIGDCHIESQVDDQSMSSGSRL